MAGQHERPLSIAILALGGQGGGVLTRWLVEVAESQGYLAQSTYLAGVAQRTGATVYSIEMFPRERAQALGREPVFSPYPIPGDVDLVIAGELAEGGRALLRGFVTEQTTLITSSHRVYAIAEKTALGDGILDQAPVLKTARQIAKRVISFDMQQIADETGSVISAVLLGAVATSAALPFPPSAFASAIEASGRSVAPNLVGFETAEARARERSTEIEPPADQSIPQAKPAGPNGEKLAHRISVELPPVVQNIALHGALRALDYQDLAYAHNYLDRLYRLRELEGDHGGEQRGQAVLAAVARHLALQMCYEDTIRVADLKTRPERLQRVRQQLSAADTQPAYVVEYVHPRFEEICDTLPAWLGARLLASKRIRRWSAPLFKRGRLIQTTKITGFLSFYWLAKLRRWRRGSYRFKVQQELINDWLGQIEAAIADDYDYALAIAQAMEIVRGYGETHERGLNRYRQAVAATSACPRPATKLRQLVQAALSDEEGRAFQQALAEGCGG